MAKFSVQWSTKVKEKEEQGDGARSAGDRRPSRPAAYLPDCFLRRTRALLTTVLILALLGAVVQDRSRENNFGICLDDESVSLEISRGGAR